MGTADGTVVGLRTRVSKKWYPTENDNIWADPTKGLSSVNIVASSPTLDDGSGQSNNMYTTCIKIKTPNSSSIGLINSITISFYVYDIDPNKGSGPLYGSLRTVDPVSGTSQYDTIDTYRTYVAGGSAEQNVYPASYPIGTYSMTFTGTFTKDTEYYLYLYTKSTNDVYHFEVSDTYACSCEYSRSYTISFSAGAGSGTVPESISGYEGEYVMIGSEIPTPPSNSVPVSTTFDIKAYNDGILFGTHTAIKNTYTKYSFDNWAGDGWIVNAGGGMTITGDITLVAQYKETQVVIYSNNTLENVINTIGTPTKSTIKIDLPVILDAETNGGTTETARLNAIKTINYYHYGWSSTSDGGKLDPNTEFMNSSSIHAIYTSNISISSIVLPTSGIYKPSQNVSTYTINLNPGAGTVDPTSIVAGKVLTYKFLGWGRTPNAVNYIATYKPNTSNETVYAIFDNGTIKYQPAKLPIPVRMNYTFVGWSTISGGTTYVDMTYMPTENVTLYANYMVSNAVEMYVYTSGSWKRLKGYLCANGIPFNECVDS